MAAVRLSVRSLLNFSVAAAALITSPVVAQEALAPAGPVQAAPVSDGGDIIVTARRREETLRDVPIAITAITGAQLTAAGVQDITAIAQTVPNLSLKASRGTNSTLTAFIRGVGQQDPVAGFEAGVGITSTTSISTARRPPSSTSSMSSVSKSCAGRRARCTVATPSVARSST